MFCRWLYLSDLVGADSLTAGLFSVFPGLAGLALECVGLLVCGSLGIYGFPMVRL